MLRLLSLLIMVGLLASCQSASSPQPDLQRLRDQLLAYVDTLDAQVGVGIISPEGDTLTINNELHYPLMSVFKFHQALGVAHHINEEKIPLKEPIYIYPKDLQWNTYSPLKEQYPHGNIQKNIAELLSYSLKLSDNIACDLLFDRLISPRQVTDFLKEIGGEANFDISLSEKDMQTDFHYCYDNWTTPYAAVLLLQQFLEGDIVGEPYLSLISQQLIDCQTGANKLALPLQGTGALIGHKTGGGPITPSGRTVANNDLGFVVLPDHRSYIIAVFVKDARLTSEASDRVIAEISRMTYQYFTSNTQSPS